MGYTDIGQRELLGKEGNLKLLEEKREQMLNDLFYNTFEEKQKKMKSGQRIKRDILGFCPKDYFDEKGNINIGKEDKYTIRENVPTPIIHQMKTRGIDKELKKNILTRITILQKEKNSSLLDLFYIGLSKLLTEKNISSEGIRIIGAVEYVFSIIYNIASVDEEISTAKKEIGKIEKQLKITKEKTVKKIKDTFIDKSGIKNIEQKSNRKIINTSIKPISLEKIKEKLEMAMSLSNHTFSEFITWELGFHEPIFKKSDKDCIQTLKQIYLGKEINKGDIQTALSCLQNKQILTYDTNNKHSINKIIGLLESYKAYKK